MLRALSHGPSRDRVALVFFVSRMWLQGARCAVLLAMSTAFAWPVRAQGRPLPDSLRADTVRAALDSAARNSAARDSVRASAAGLERVLVQALRAGNNAPIAQTSIDRDVIRQRSFGQDVPLMLQGAVPSLIAHNETGTNFGYSYLRLRGLDQTRINLSIDGIPLNDPEDQVFYFANFPDLGTSVQSVQVQRGVGTTGAGTAAFAGSVNFETRPVAAMSRGGALEVQGGSFNAQRLMAEGSTGLLSNGFAAYARLSGVRTDGYRNNAGVAAASGVVSAGWFGVQNSVKLLAAAGVLRDTLSYLAASEDELRANRRFNPLGADEQDRFAQQLLGLTATHSATNGAMWATTLYRMSAAGNYDVRIEPDPVNGLWNFNLDHTWYGVTSAVNHTIGAVQLNAGINANTYARDHFAFIGAQRDDRLYDNTGHKQDAALFGKGAWSIGAVTLFGDVQLRTARFRYEPTEGSGVTTRDVQWTFLNPRVGATWQITPQLSWRTSLGRTTREPTRTDMLGGADDLDTAQADAIGDFRRVRPEEVTNLEFGTLWQGARGALDVNVFAMEFRNEIAAIGELTPIGAPLRQNVSASARRGVELDGDLRVTERLTLGGNVAWLHARIREFVDNSDGVPVTFRNVQPLLSPSWLSAQRAHVLVSRRVTVGLEGRYQGTAFLRNDDNRGTVLPAFYVLDATLRTQVGRIEVTARGVNLGDSQRYSSGYAFGGVPYYYVLPPRSVFVTARVGL